MTIFISYVPLHLIYRYMYITYPLCVKIKQSLDTRYYCTIILYNIIDVPFKQFKTNGLEAISFPDNNIVQY